MLVGLYLSVDCLLLRQKPKQDIIKSTFYVDIVSEQVDNFEIFTTNSPTLEEIEKYVNFMKTNFNIPVIRTELYIKNEHYADCFPNENGVFHCFYVNRSKDLL